jgi:hypothetical protein
MTTYLLLQEISSGVAVEESHTSSCPEDFVKCIGIQYSIFNANTFNPNRSPPESSESPHKHQSPPRQQQWLRRD